MGQSVNLNAIAVAIAMNDQMNEWTLPKNIYVYHDKLSPVGPFLLHRW